MQYLTSISFPSSSSRYTTSFLVPISNFPNLNVTRRRNPLSNEFTDSFLFFPKTPFLRLPFASYSTRRWRISAGLVRGKSRRNHLREKMIGRDVSQVREILKELKKSGFDSKFYSEKNGEGKENSYDVLGGGNSDLQDNSDTMLDFRADGDEKEGNVELGTLSFQKSTGIEKEVREELDFDDGLKTSDVHVPKESALWDKLDSWIECYKRDNEVWGVGTGPIFVIYENSNGSVSKVDVNEDEIVKRSRIEAWSLREESCEEEWDVKSRISRAKVIAKEIMSGERKLSKSSSVAKYVVEGEKVSRADRLEAIANRAKTLTKFSPTIGVTILLGYFVFLVVMKLPFGDGRVEPTSEEKEMLRRKLIARKERGSMVKGSVEVVQTAPELPKVLDKRPELDKDELRKSLLKAKASNYPAAVLESSDNSHSHDHVFEEKVRKIRDMARKARESEREMLESNNTSVEEKKLQVGMDIIQPDINNVIVKSPVDVNEDGLSPVVDDSVNQYSEHNDTENESSNASLGSSSLLTKSSSGIKPYIIRSVKEAREYLSKKHGKPVEESNSHQSASNSFNDKKDYTSGRDVKALKCDTWNVSGGVKGEKENMPSSADISDKTFCVNKDMDNANKNIGVKSTEPHAANERKFFFPSDGLRTTDIAPKDISCEVEVGQDMDNEKENTDVKSPKPHAIGESRFNFASDGPWTTDVVVPKDRSREIEAEIPRYQSQDCFPKKAQQKNKMKKGNSSEADVENTKFHSVNVKDIKGNENSETDEEVMMPPRSQSQDCFPKKVQQKNKMKKGNSSEVDVENTEFHSVNVKGKENSESDEEVMMPPVNSPDIDVVESSSINQNMDHLKTYPDSDDISKDLEFRAMTHSTISESNESKPEDSNAFIPKRDVNSSGQSAETEHRPEPQARSRNKWIEENFQNFDPVIKKIGVGFKENYMTAKENKEEQKLINVDISELGLSGDEEELEWMNDDKLRNIVLQVRDNELAGHDPFHLMTVDDQNTFFTGLEKKAEKMNAKLQGLHEWIHSRIENIDYGADGISLHDPLEKIIPRWKGPPIDTLPNQKIFSKGVVSSVESDGSGGKLQTSKDQSYTGGDSTYSVHNLSKMQNGVSAKPKTVIESSDGSIRVGKKGRKEQWEHTKKWSREFLELYNAETDPEIKSVMKDMGKDLDKWITPTEIQETADLMTKIPKKKRQFIEKKLNKLKREIEMFGPQAVVSKYKEYSEDKEEDYLWWLDLKFVLCIELYTLENDIQKVGFYSLEMAEDLELNPKQYHVIAFQDPADAKNFCYIMQAHLEMLGTGSAFVVARPPKDAFREAKANGFHVTVIRKGEIKLNIDQTLEEVEEKLLEIGNKMYHDKIMRERSVDMGTLMKGVFASGKSKKRRIPRTLAKNNYSANVEQSNIDRK